MVTSALHMPLLTPFEARTIGKRAGSLPIFSKLAGYKKRGTRPLGGTLGKAPSYTSR